MPPEPTSAALRCSPNIFTSCNLFWVILLWIPVSAFTQTLVPQTPASLLHAHALVTLMNGNVLSGEITAESVRTLTIQNDVIGTILIPRAGISNIAVPQTPAQEKNSANVLMQQNTVATSSPQIQSAQTPPGALADANKLYLAKFKVGGSILEATQKQQSYSGELDLIKNWHSDETGWKHQRSLLLLSPTYDDKSSSKGANVTHNYNGIFQHIIFTSDDNLYVPIFSNLYSNNSLGIYLQQAYGAGIGKTFGALEISGDLRFVGQHFYAPSKPNPPVASLGLFGSGLSERYDLALSAIRPGAKLQETIEFVPVFNSSDAWQAHGIAEISIPFNQQLSFVLSAFDNYMQNAPPTFRQNYFKTSIGLQYSPTTKK